MHDDGWDEEFWDALARRRVAADATSDLIERGDRSDDGRGRSSEKSGEPEPTTEAVSEIGQKLDFVLGELRRLTVEFAALVEVLGGSAVVEQGDPPAGDVRPDTEPGRERWRL